VIGYKFLSEGAVAPFTGFRWPRGGEWVSAPAERVDVWIHACRVRDLAHWLDAELWCVELGQPVREARYQVASPRGRLVARVAGWDAALARELAAACAVRARDLALPHLAPEPRAALAGAAGPEAIGAVAAAIAGPSAAGMAGPPTPAAYVANAAHNALFIGPATTAYIAAALASSLGGGLAAFDAEREWQASWLAERLGLERAGGHP
jgi:hypothetical protein